MKFTSRLTHTAGLVIVLAGLLPAQVPSISITSFAPNSKVELYPNDRAFFKITVAITGQPRNSDYRTVLYVRETSQKDGNRLFKSSEADGRQATATLSYNYNVPAQWCPTCPGGTNRITALDITANLLDKPGGSIVSQDGPFPITVKYPEISVSIKSQDLMSQR